MLDDFTAENGATAVRPGTQVKSEYPWDSEDFHRHMVQAEGTYSVARSNNEETRGVTIPFLLDLNPDPDPSLES